MSTVTVIYACAGCGVSDRKVEVRARGEDEDVVAWTEAMGRAVGRDHRIVSPSCKSTTMEHVKIPVKDATGEALSIGYPIRPRASSETVVFIVLGSWVDDTWIEGVFATEAEAEAHAAAAKKAATTIDFFEVVPWTVGKARER